MQKFLQYASEMYYHGTPIMSDAVFDRLAFIHGFNQVGHPIIDGVLHLYPMLSLQKAYTEKEIPEYIHSEKTVTTTKLDGAAVSLLYIDGKLRLALTRGCGKMGQDITEKMSYLVRTEIGCRQTMQITGEVVAPSSISNARNYAAGSLNLKDINEFRNRQLFFYAYDCTPNVEETYTDEMTRLERLGFRTVLTDTTEGFPNDGKVIRIDDYKTFLQLGSTAHHPRGAIALKEQKEGVLTKLLDVVWQVGKSGAVSPVAILQPVNIGDAVISRATLHNIQYIEELNLEIGCIVEVIRSGEIIPRIVRRVA